MVRPAIGPGANQRGAALVVSLILLLVMTLLGVVTLRNTSLEERMAANQRDRQMAFDAAEAALYAAEQDIENNVITLAGFDGDGSDGLYDEDADLNGDGDVDADDEAIWRHIDWAGTASGNSNKARTYTGFSGNVASAPAYVIRHEGTVEAAEDELNLGNYGEGTGAGETDLFEITVRATGGSESATVILQSTFGKRL
ncbi:pilus assembly PilX family protein [Spiribacter halobius]|uniref:Type 4 fimbrial biogenesis protein PilX N-terminal domain-containing protein n=1 Tax=Sediminicurvatus halobius TaxID=2182432 RepID=A0A2U2N7U3_9GAMM|nr:PilX N-terminal domain-containing pilus assembly protein [Spiribacter halobius]PWG65143.1 hypothetical protein DEM34_02370 [Spiribacter halobius]UEX78907.1 pilus assembly protein [Spiribacter halobius]